ncbi:hypothetical protein WDU94_007770 [Cyamophila willieti]
MVSEVRALPPLVISGEQDAAAAAWKLWLQRFKLFLSANGYDSEDAKEDKQVFQNVISNIYENEDGVEPYIDDIIVYGKTVEEHDEKLEKVLCIARENNIRFNPEKCVFNVSEVKFLGHVIDGEGVQ